MRWFRIRKAKIDPELRKTFERYGVGSMQGVLAGRMSIWHKGKLVPFEGPEGYQRIEDSLLPWLTEQYDRAERKEMWSLTMECAITVFVALELLSSTKGTLYRIFCRIFFR